VSSPVKPGRNDPCPCGSGRKYKQCCGAVTAAPTPGVNRGDLDALAAMIQGGRLAEAEQRLRTLLEDRPTDGTLWKFLSVAQQRQGKDALASLRRAAELLPDDAEAHANLGGALCELRRWEPALASLERSLALEPRNPAVLLDAANVLRSLGRASEALPLYRTALELEPRSAEGHNNLGNALLELRQLADAVACYRRALAVRPQDAQIHFNLGLALAALGERAEAVASYRRTLELNPANVEALNNLGGVLREVGQRREALALYQRAIELDPRRPDSHFNLGTVLLELRRIGDAEDSFRRALALQASYTQAQLGLAAVLRVQGRTTEAEGCCEAALAAEAGSAGAASMLAELRADRGRFAEALELFQQAIRLDPGFTTAFCGIAQHRRMTREDSGWLQGVEALLAKPLPLGQQVSLHYALGKYCDDIGEYDRAFDSYRQANELSKRFGTGYDRGKLTRRIDAIVATFGAGFVQQAHAGASDSQLPIFIVGMPRSGTSLTEQILASHPDVFGAGEVRFWDDAYTALERAVAGGASTASLLPGLAAEYLGRLSASGAGRARVIDKMPANFLYLGLIHAALPRARIVHMQRHPLDTCLSIYFQNFFNMGPYANDFGNLAHYYQEYLRIMAHWRAVLPRTALLEVPYEELLADQEGWTRRMLDFLRLPWDAKCLDFHQTDRVVITASRWQVRQKMHRGSAGRWHHYEKFVGPLRHLTELTPRA
jgi:tetratricopeptide (TPR) repeat protein